MEKLKAKHDHKLTDILKVIIFALFLILPGLIVLPSMLYYGVNEHATAPTKTTEVYEYKQIDFNQLNNEFTIASTTQSLVINSPYSFSLDNEFNDRITPIWSATIPFKQNHKYEIITNWPYSIHTSSWQIYFGNNVKQIEAAQTLDAKLLFDSSGATYPIIMHDVYYFNIFDLTQMYGVGNEPTVQEFETYFTNIYYPYTESETKIITIDTGETETYTDITSQIQYNWTSLWKQPLFSWTNYTIVKQGIDNFTGVFGITNTSNISNLIAYELIIVAIYIVIDILITMFKWLTHLIGEK